MALSHLRKYFRFLGPLLGLVLFGLAFWVLQQSLREYRLEDILGQLRSLELVRAGAAVALVAAAYLTLTGYDRLAFRYVGSTLPYRKIGLASFIGYALTNNTGGSFSFVAGGSVRYRLYAAWGLSAVEIGKIIVFCIATFWLGFLGLAGTLFLVEPVAVPGPLQLPEISASLLGLVFLAAVAAYLFWQGFWKKAVIIRGHRFETVGLRLALSQLAVSCLQWIAVGGSLYALLPASPGLSFLRFEGVFLMAFLAGTASQVPGGLGVFETVMVVLLRPYLPAAAVLGSLLAFRGLYYLLPLGVAAGLLGGYEVYRKRRGISHAAQILEKKLTGAVPQLLGLLVFGAGIFLLFSGVVHVWPKAGSLAPVPVLLLELLSVGRGLAGLILLVVARGLWQRLAQAYGIAAGVLGASIVMSLMGELDAVSALVPTVVLLLLLPWRPEFQRRSPLGTVTLTTPWLVITTVVVLMAVWLGHFSAKPLEKAGSWWRVLGSADPTGHFWRSSGALFLMLLLLIIIRYRSRARSRPFPLTEQIAAAGRLVVNSPRAQAQAALLGGKSFLFSSSGKGFLMSAQAGRSRIALGDPVGPAREAEELLYRFRELCEDQGEWPVVYNAGDRHLSRYLAIGLLPVPLAEEARVFLPTFSPGELAPSLALSWRRLGQGDWTWEVVTPAALSPLLPRLRNISEEWLRAGRQEKHFVSGGFSEQYLQRLPVGVLRHRSDVMGFGVLWPSAGHQELAVDVLRWQPEAPAEMLDMLLLRILAWGREQGYGWLNLGLAPLTGREEGLLTPVWQEDALLFPGVEPLTEVAVLRVYKEGFRPQWRLRYLYTPGTLLLPAIMADLTNLIRGKDQQHPWRLSRGQRG